VNNNYLDLGMSKSGFIHTLPSGRLMRGIGHSAWFRPVLASKVVYLINSSRVDVVLH
jgi:hypothetical protein